MATTPSNSRALADRIEDRAQTPDAVTGSKTIRDLLEEHKPQVEAALPRHLDVDRFMRLILTECRTIPHLLDCSFPSLMSGVMKCAQLGLETGPLGLAYLLPFYSNKLGSYECTFILGYRGIINLARRGGDIKDIAAREVCEKDDFEIEYGLDERLVHRPKMTDRGDPIAYYGIARFTDGGHHMLVLSKDDIEARRSRSKAKDNGPWRTDYDAMARKTVIRAMAPYLPLTTESAEAIADEREYIDEIPLADMGLPSGIETNGNGNDETAPPEGEAAP